MFYATLTLFLKTGPALKTSKHTGIISTFDKEFVKTGKFDKRYSKLLHDVFDARLESDYKETVEMTFEDAIEYIAFAEEFIDAIKVFIAES